jgi:tetratricopeptide (TPR) repeat protein
MRASTIAMLIVGLALWYGQTLAQPSPTFPPAPALLPSPNSPPAPASLPSPKSPPSSPSLPSPPSPSLPAPSSQPRYSADGLYNLANSYARAGKPGLAVLNYERAALLAPDDADINANLEYVRAFAHVPTEPRARIARIAQAANPNLAAWIGVLGVALVGTGVLAIKLARRFQWLGAGGILLGVALIALTVYNAMLLWPRMHEAVVLINETPARVSPVPMGDTTFVLREAETVTMTAEHEDFVLIRTRGGLSGWVARAHLGPVVPQVRDQKLSALAARQVISH